MELFGVFVKKTTLDLTVKGRLIKFAIFYVDQRKFFCFLHSSALPYSHSEAWEGEWGIKFQNLVGDLSQLPCARYRYNNMLPRGPGQGHISEKVGRERRNEYVYFEKILWMVLVTLHSVSLHHWEPVDRVNRQSEAFLVNKWTQSSTRALHWKFIEIHWSKIEQTILYQSNRLKDIEKKRESII